MNQVRRGAEQLMIDDATGQDLSVIGDRLGIDREPGESDADYRDRVMSEIKITR